MKQNLPYTTTFLLDCAISDPSLTLHSIEYMFLFVVLRTSSDELSLPMRASEQGNVIGLVSVYIYICVIKKNVSEPGI